MLPFISWLLPRRNQHLEAFPGQQTTREVRTLVSLVSGNLESLLQDGLAGRNLSSLSESIRRDPATAEGEQ